MQRILFVCLGNICRSPTAHGVFAGLAQRARLAVHVDSAGTGAWHAGDPPDPRARAEAKRRGYDLDDLRARVALAADFDRFDLILAMDGNNLRALERLRPPGNATPVRLLRDYGDRGGDVPDPYYDGRFGEVFDLVEDACRGLIAALQDQPGQGG